MKIIVDNLATEHQEEGKGNIVLMLHGWGDNLHSFDLIATDISKSFRVIRLDLPGFGGTEAPKETWDLNNYVSFINDFQTKLKIKPYAIVGHSFGGRISIKGLSENKLTTEKLILIASAGVANRKTIKNILFLIIAKIANIILLVPPFSFYKENIKKRFYRNIGSDYYDAGSLKPTFVKVVNENLSENAKKIEVPTFLIWGSHDMATPISEGKRLHSLIKNSKLIEIDGAGHFVHKENPEKVTMLIKEFL